MRRFPVTLLFAAVALCALVVGACSSSSGDATGETTDPAATSTTASATSTTTTTTSTTTTTTTTSPPAVTTSTRRPAASTVDDLLALDRPVVIAHAGGDRSWPHSTPYAYAMAVAAGVDVLEMDVQLTADGVLIIQHDDTVDRTTGSTGRVRDLTLAEIQALDNAYWFVPGYWTDQTRPPEEYVLRGIRTGDREPPPGFTAEDFRVATFREIAERYPDHVLDIEIKVQRGDDGEPDPAAGAAAAEALAAAVADLGREASVIVTSFDDDTLAAFRAAAPGVTTSPAQGALTAWFLGDGTLDPADRILQVPPFFSGIEVISTASVARAHDEGYAVWAWMDDPSNQENAEFYAHLLDLGVDGLIAGRPAEAVAVVSPAG